MPNVTLSGLFPIPIGISKLERTFSKKELTFIESMSRDTSLNILNARSNNSYVLDDAVMADLKKFCQESLFKFVNAHNPPASENVTSYITQSWLNFNKKNEGHHAHKHANSIISGVLYINVVSGIDNICFTNPNSRILRYTPKEWNMFNSDEWSVPVTSGDLLLFPSTLEHYVKSNESDNIRISLSFNSFIKGNLGIKEGLTELIL